MHITPARDREKSVQLYHIVVIVQQYFFFQPITLRSAAAPHIIIVHPDAVAAVYLVRPRAPKSHEILQRLLPQIRNERSDVRKTLGQRINVKVVRIRACVYSVALCPSQSEWCVKTVPVVCDEKVEIAGISHSGLQQLFLLGKIIREELYRLAPAAAARAESRKDDLASVRRQPGRLYVKSGE